MAVATFEGFIHNGEVRLVDKVRLPEDTKVYVFVPELTEQTVPYDTLVKYAISPNAGAIRIMSPRIVDAARPAFSHP